MTGSGSERGRVEEIKVAGHELLATVKGIINEGNVRRVVIMNSAGRTLLDIPLTAGIVVAMLLPVWAAIGGIAALAGGFTIVVERIEDGAP